MKKFILLPFAAFMALAAAVPALADQVPAGYIVSMDLHGADRTANSAVVREGGDQPAKLMMPLYQKDTIVLLDPLSTIEIEVNGGEPKEITGKMGRFEVTGEVPTGDDIWTMMADVFNVIGSKEGETVPDNMASRGDENELKIPMAVKGPNFIAKDTAKLWLAWSGGKGPYKVIVDVDGRAKSYDKIREQEFEFETPPRDAKRFTVTLKDSEGRITNVVMRYRDNLPSPNEGFKGSLPGGDVKDIAYAAWMTGLHEGDWTIGAAQLLRSLPGENKEAKLLLAKIVEGWKYQN